MMSNKPTLEIPGYEGRYSITADGEIWSHPKDYRGDAKHSGKTLSIRLNRNSGYMVVNLSKDNKVKTELVHRLVAMTWVEGRTEESVVNHKDGNKLNNSASNLEWVTTQANLNHAFATGLNKGPLGESNNMTKLTEKDVFWIRDSTEISRREIADLYGITRQTVDNIVNRKTWRHV